MIPTYDKMMLPILRELGSGTPKNTDDCVNAISRHFQLSSEDLAHHLPSGRQTTVRNRVGWARVRLRKAGLIESTARGIDRITETGLGVLESGVEALNDDYLMRFQPYRAWVERSQTRSKRRWLNGMKPSRPSHLRKPSVSAIPGTVKAYRMTCWPESELWIRTGLRGWSWSYL